MGFTEDQRFPPDASELNNLAIEPVCRKYAELRYQLMPYTYTLAAEARESGMPLMRALWLHYPEDERVRGIGDQYLWGRDLHVAPVYRQGATSRDVYLPAGKWVDFWTNAVELGGKTVTREVDLATMPVYVRAGAILPVDPVRQYVEQEVEEPTTLRVYSGVDGRFRWYEDDGKSLGYLDGEFTWTSLSWDDAGRHLTIRRDPGAAGWEPAQRKLVVQVLPEGAIREIEYGGGEVRVDF
jgi:alpha-glucosidase/alpha-D-xyloside xylohydrolase